MQIFSPENFREIVSALTFLVGIIFSFITVAKNDRTHFLRVAGLFFVISISLFADRHYCYFAALFIVGTVITTPKFLQNLAAIIRGNKAYFEYMKEYLTQPQMEQIIEAEIKEVSSAKLEDSNQEVPESRIERLFNREDLCPSHVSYIAHEYTLNYLEKKYNRPIQKHVRFKGITNVFDGLLLNSSTDVIFEIIIVKGIGISKTYIIQKTLSLITSIEEYTNISKREANLRFILIGDFNESVTQILRECRTHLISMNKYIDVQYETYSFEDIGLSDFNWDSLKKP